MSFVFATPEYVAAAASDLANIGSAISSANASAVGPTASVPAAGADEVSAGIAALFGAHAQAYQALSAQAALFHQQFVQLMSAGAAQYALAEAANAGPLEAAGQGVMAGVATPLQALGAMPGSGAGATGVLAADTGAPPGSLGPGVGGASGQLVGSVGAGPAAAAVGGGVPTPLGAGGAGYAGSLAASGGPVGAAQSGVAQGAEELGVGAYSAPAVAAEPGPSVTPLAAVPAAAPAAPTAAARPGTPAYSPAPAAPAEPSEE
ncbi:hypothetical protein BST11_00180 [Mycobacterium alsense]|uniref:PE family protein n=1 Tax=Mycobacterium alsense TaxID=324058 RepID=A0AA41XPH9_9MYCO|nr:PE family protein [Mycobacterium alsense]MCV7378799.1 PE family protein [Mycobacterium alsense]OQZ93773.1 hypothetical protein BST11_00180 [Mycobacterium alsense]